jgi:hypothetical protein
VVWQAVIHRGLVIDDLASAMAIGLNPRLYTLSTAKCHRLVAIRTFVILR